MAPFPKKKKKKKKIDEKKEKTKIVKKQMSGVMAYNENFQFFFDFLFYGFDFLVLIGI